MQALIVSGGCIEDSFAVDYVQKHVFDLVIAADSGMAFFARNGWVPDYIVGDFDSVEQDILKVFLHIAEPGTLRGEDGAKEPGNRGHEACRLEGLHGEAGAKESGDRRHEACCLEGLHGEADAKGPGDRRHEACHLEGLQGVGSAKEAGDRERKPVILQFQPEKDETDTEIAIRTAIEKGCDKIHLLGATGTRLDHMLGNVHLLGMAMEQGVECLLVDAHNRIRMVKDSLVLKKEEQYGNYVSLLPFTPEVKGLTLRGMKYPLDRAVLKCYHSLGVSNEIVGEQAEISFEEGVLLVLETKD